MDERGFSLVESVVAITILGLIVAAMVGAIATTIATSDLHRQQSEANTVLVSQAETVKRMGYLTCPVRYPPSNPWATNSVRFWNPVNAQWESACHDRDGASLFPMQLVTIKVTHPGKRAVVSIDIVKQRPAPVVSGLSPASGPAGTLVTISGTGFTGATKVVFGTTVATSFVTMSDTQITATVLGGPGPVDVTVATPAGTSASVAADLFTITP